ncbi:protein kinase [Angomonas deanei]|uniref:Protein kinase domain/Protein tyrosine kinase, putative n=1 Tax=Angomonas deanei TaxID=59799 RepID=A0A7G2CP61_9TRYP|nr:protein kinase [Angomonas deanei]CAD2220897.1 Protein kinase domain/Protein tyrosine kinase, putative [Angomonas deanei]|eukprot:EPY21635.1 protein kinase [Angomonas deanei]
MEMLSGKLVAMKFMPIPFDEADIDGIEAEVSIMQRVKGAYVVELITYAFAGDTILLVMECMMAGSLQNMISAFHVISNVTARVFMRDVLRGLSRLHSYGIIHRDVKPQNVLLTLSGTCKISDFGASTWLQRLVQKEYQGVVQGTPVYLAPEAARGITEMASDLWSCGIMYLQLITGHLPYPKEKLNLASPILVYQIGSGQAVPVIPDDLDELDAAFVKCCLQTDAEKRSTAEKLLQMPLFVL